MSTTQNIKGWLSTRFANESDANALYIIVNKAYREPGGWTGENHLIKGSRITHKSLNELIKEDPKKSRLIVCEKASDYDAADKVIVGCVVVKWRNEEEGEIGMLSVNPEVQSRGIGSTLMIKAFEVLKNDFKFKRAVVTVIHLRSELIAWYKKIGFVENGEVEPFPEVTENNDNGTPIVDNVYFIVLKKEL
ncbi:yiiD [Acrasis kona]|uniref:YiiD n=1 Tax=Acrasis kona TaxID=1008807 RepID=A0AAW2ZB38_9EUKA